MPDAKPELELARERVARVYSPSGGFRIEALFLIPGAACASSAFLSPLYAAEAALVPLVFVNVLAALAYGVATGVLSGWSVTAAHVRSPFLAAALTVAGGTAGFLMSLAGWVGALPGGGPPLSDAGFAGAAVAAFASAPSLAADPGGLVTLAFAGVRPPWSFMGMAPSGAWLAVVWALQWLAFAAGVSVPALALASRPYSDEGGVWLERARHGARRFALPEGAGGADVIEGIAGVAGTAGSEERAGTDRTAGTHGAESEEGAAVRLEKLRKDAAGGNLEYFLSCPLSANEESCLELRILSHEKAPLSAVSVRFVPAKGKPGSVPTIVKNVLVSSETAKRIAERG